jgi:hypothetical protein
VGFLSTAGGGEAVIMSGNMMTLSRKYPVDAKFLKAAIQRDIGGEVEYIAGSPGGWTVYLRDPRDLPVCHVQIWEGQPVTYAVLPRAAA